MEISLRELPDLTYGSILEAGYLIVCVGLKTIPTEILKEIFSHFGVMKTFIKTETSDILIVRYKTPWSCVSLIQALRGQVVNGKQISILLDSSTTSALRQYCLLYRRQFYADLSLADVQVTQPLSPEFTGAIDKIRYQILTIFNSPESYIVTPMKPEELPLIELDKNSIIKKITEFASELQPDEIQEIIEEILEFRTVSLNEYMDSRKEYEREELIEFIRREVLSEMSSTIKERRS